MGESEAGRALYKLKNSWRVAKFRKAANRKQSWINQDSDVYFLEVKMPWNKAWFLYIRPNQQVGKMKRILHSDKLPECASWAHLAPLGFSVLVPQEKGLFLAIYNKSSVNQVCSVMTAGYWPHSFFHFFLTTTSCQSIKAQKTTWPISSHLKTS